jgi:hypothetical protein
MRKSNSVQKKSLLKRHFEKVKKKINVIPEKGNGDFFWQEEGSPLC